MKPGSASLFSRAREVTITGGTFNAVGGNFVQGVEPREIADMLADVRETIAQTIDRRLEEMMGHLQPSVISTGFLYVMDATGRRHTVTMDMAHSFEQFTAALRVLFLPEQPQNRVLQKYMDMGAFVLTIDDGREHLQLTNQEEWTSTIQGGMTIVMSVVMTQEVYEVNRTRYQCPFCDCWNRLKGHNGKSSIDCRSCKRRFQVKPADQEIQKTQIATVSTNERDLIRNIDLRQRDITPEYQRDLIELSLRLGSEEYHLCTFEVETAVLKASATPIAAVAVAYPHLATVAAVTATSFLSRWDSRHSPLLLKFKSQPSELHRMRNREEDVPRAI